MGETATNIPAGLSNVWAVAGGYNDNMVLTSPFNINLNLFNLIGDVPQTNTVAAGGIVYYAVYVPTNADFTTNILDFATGPLNLWFNQTNLPVTTNPPDYQLLGGSTGGIGSPVLSAISAPPLLPRADLLSSACKIRTASPSLTP